MLYAQVHLTLPAWVHEAVDPLAWYPQPEQRMALAIALARRNVVEGTGGPFGAALFSSSGRLLGIGVNRVIAQHCSAAHAEMMAFMTAQQRLGRHRLNEDGLGVCLASSAQPCAMCYGASLWAGIDELLIGARKEDVEELSDFDEGPLPADWVGELEARGIRVVRDLLRAEAREVFALYRRQGGAHY